MQLFDAGDVARRLLGCDSLRVRMVRRGRNAEIWRVDAAERAYALKHYVQADAQDRLERETAALRFLERHGVANVPRLIGADADAGAVLLSWLTGDAISRPTERDVRACIDFVVLLRHLSRQGCAAGLSGAKEACDSVSAILSQIDRRIMTLDSLSGVEMEVRAFIDREVLPRRLALDRLRDRFPGKFMLESQTLSPSDFGVHNAVRSANGQLQFMDFEYFGWDDGVKLAADFLLHPGMTLPERMRELFTARICALFGREEGFAGRLSALFPAYRLRWALIMMNPILGDIGSARARNSVNNVNVKAEIERVGRFLAAAAPATIGKGELYGAG